RLATFLQALQELGWTDGRNVRIDVRWGAGDADRNRRHAAELVALAPDVILASGGSLVGTLLQATTTVPIVFTQTPDPVGAGFVESLARPGGNATGFSIFDYSLGGKWLEVLKQIAPGVTRVGYSRPCYASRDRAVLGAPLSCAIARPRGNPGQRARRRRSRPRPGGCPTQSE